MEWLEHRRLFGAYQVTFEHTLIAISIAWVAVPTAILIYLWRHPPTKIKTDELRKD